MKVPNIEYTHPDCDHSCMSDCSHEGCNCLCGEFHGMMDKQEYEEAVDELNANADNIK